MDHTEGYKSSSIPGPSTDVIRVASDVIEIGHGMKGLGKGIQNGEITPDLAKYLRSGAESLRAAAKAIDVIVGKQLP
jgi:hypothetical protein